MRAMEPVANCTGSSGAAAGAKSCSHVWLLLAPLDDGDDGDLDHKEDIRRHNRDNDVFTDLSCFDVI